VLHLTPRGRAGIARFEQSLTDFFRASEPLVKEVMLLLGRDPEHAHQTGAVLGALEVADRLSAAGASYGQELLPRMHAFGANETVDRFALTVLAQAWARPSWLADELALSPAGTTSLLERLEVAGLAVREPGALETDRRAVVVHLTPRGRRAARVLLEVFRKYQDALLDGLEPTLAHAAVGTTG
jgi:DNA-binding MarR family transcriptional regulator